jgi:uncharacterized protein YecE (DUF72 family)
MEFGKVTDEQLESIDFTLPAEPGSNKAVLKKGKKAKTEYYIGCAKWGRKDWIGKLYPKGTKEKDFLEYYAGLFNSIEFNATFYKTPTREQVATWKSKVGEGFKFCPKFTQNITHLKRLNNAQHEVDGFLSAIHEFGDNLGPIFLMPHPQMSIKHMPVIEHFMQNLPVDVDVFLELRHPDWYADGYYQPLYDLLKDLKRGTIITDAAGRRDCVHMHLSTPECFIRFVGNSLHPTDYTRVDSWVDQILKWRDEGLKTCYFFMHQHEELHSPELIQYFINKLNEQGGENIPPIKMQGGGDNTLF